MRWIFVRPTDGRVRAGWRYTLFLVALAASGVAASVIIRALAFPSLRGADGVVQPGALLLRGALVGAATLGVTALLLRLVEGRPLSSVGLPLDGPWLRGTGTGLVLGATPVALLVILLAATGHAEVGPGAVTPVSLLASWLPSVLGLALVSSVEELVLRGYGLQLLAEAGGRWMAAVVTGVLFGLMHAENPGANPVGLASTAVNGILLAWLVMRTGSLWMACAYHASWNIAGAMIFGMRLSGLDQGAGLLATRLAGPDWLTGGAYGFEGSVLVSLLELVTLGLAVAAAPRLPGVHPGVVPFFGSREKLPPSARG